MDEKSAFAHTVKSLVDAWLKLRPTFSSVIDPLLEWYLDYARCPIVSFIDLVEHLYSTEFPFPVPDQPCLAQAVLQYFQRRSKVDLFKGNNIDVDPTLPVRTIKLFGMLMPVLLPEVRFLFPKSSFNLAIYESVGTVVRSILTSSHDERFNDALCVVDACPAIHGLNRNEILQLIIFAMGTGRNDLIDRLINECHPSVREEVLVSLDACLPMEGTAFLDHVYRLLGGHPQGNWLITRRAIFSCLSRNVFRYNANLLCRNFMYASKYKLYRYLTLKTFSTTKPEMDISSFVDAVKEMAEGDAAFQEEVISSLRALGHIDLVNSFTVYFKEMAAASASKHNKSGASTTSFKIPERFLTTKPIVPRNAVLYAPSLQQDDVILITDVNALTAAVDVIKHIDLMALRLFWRRHPHIDRTTPCKVSLLVIAIPRSVFIFDIFRLKASFDFPTRSAFSGLETILASENIQKLIFLPNSDERALKAGQVFSENFKVIRNCLSLKKLSLKIDPTLKLDRLSSVVHSWLLRVLPSLYRLTNWATRPLSPEQIKYAVTECYSMLDVHYEMSSYCHKSQIDFDSIKAALLHEQSNAYSSESESEMTEAESDGEVFKRQGLPPPKVVPKIAPLLPAPLPQSVLPPLLPVGQQRFPTHQADESPSKTVNVPQQPERPQGISRNFGRTVESVDRVMRSYLFVVSQEFVNVAVELCRLDFIVHLCSSLRSDMPQMLKLSSGKLSNRVIITTREMTASLRNQQPANNSGVLSTATLYSQEDLQPNIRHVVEPILRLTGLSSEDIDRHYESRRFPVEDAPLIIYHPRSCFAIKMLKDLRLNGKYNFCPSPDIIGHPGEPQLAAMAGFGLPNNGNRILVTSGKANEKVADRQELRVIIVPPFTNDRITGEKPGTGHAKQTELILEKIHAIVPPYILPSRNQVCRPSLLPHPEAADQGQPGPGSSTHSAVQAPNALFEASPIDNKNAFGKPSDHQPSTFTSLETIPPLLPFKVAAVREPVPFNAPGPAEALSLRPGVRVPLANNSAPVSNIPQAPNTNAPPSGHRLGVSDKPTSIAVITPVPVVKTSSSEKEIVPTGTQPQPIASPKPVPSLGTVCKPLTGSNPIVPVPTVRPAAAAIPSICGGTPIQSLNAVANAKRSFHTGTPNSGVGASVASAVAPMEGEQPGGGSINGTKKTKLEDDSLIIEELQKMKPVQRDPKPKTLLDIRLLFFSANSQVTMLEIFLKKVGFASAYLSKATYSPPAALLQARKQSSVLVVDTQSTLDSLASYGAHSGEAILLSAPEGRLFTQARMLAEKFNAGAVFKSIIAGNLMKSSEINSKLKEPPIRLFIYGESLKNLRQFLSKIPAFFEVTSTIEQPDGTSATTSVAGQQAFKGAFDAAAAFVIQTERILVADFAHAQFFKSHEHVSHLLLAPDRTIDLARFLFNDIFTLPVQLLLPPFRPSAVDKLHYIIHSKSLSDFGTYIKLAGLDTRIDTINKTFPEACAVAKREKRFLISIKTRDTANYLWSNPNILAKNSVLLLSEEVLKTPSLSDLTKRIFDQVAARSSSAEN